jgi:predicted Rossmann-fold nucleotide-binding protein
MSRLIIYLSGPISEFDRYKMMFGEFALAALKRYSGDPSRQVVVINPADYPEGLSYEHYMELSMIHVRRCDVLIELPGCEDSRGAQAEIQYAITLVKDVLPSDDLCPVLTKFWKQHLSDLLVTEAVCPQ